MKSTFWKKVLASSILVLSILAIHSIARASAITQSAGAQFNTSTMMPSNSSGPTGMFPQNYLSAGRTVYLSDKRFLTTTNQWKATMSGSIVYCSDYHAYVRFSKKEEEQKFLYYKGNKGGLVTKVQGEEIEPTPGFKTVEEIINTFKETVYNKYKSTIVGTNFYKDPENNDFTVMEYTDGNGGDNTEDFRNTLEIQINGLPLESSGDQVGWYDQNEKIRYAIAVGDFLNLNNDLETGNNTEVDSSSTLSTALKYGMDSIYDQLKEGENAKKFLNDDSADNSTNANSENKNNSDRITAVYGPKVLVMENGDTPGYTKSEEYTFNNEKLSFIFSACENAYGTEGSYAQKYTINDIQTAYWQYLARNSASGIKDESGTREEPTTHITDTDLYDKSEEYEEFVKQEMGENLEEANYQSKVTINTSLAQVIANRDKKEYVVGPYSIDYPYYKDISYMTAISITGNGTTLWYDQNHDDIKIVLEPSTDGATTLEGSNGITKVFPNKNQKFFVIFSASALSNPTSAKLNAQFEYLKETKVDSATLLTTHANTYQYMGYCQIGQENYNAIPIQLKWRVDYKVGKVTEASWDHEGTTCRIGQDKGDGSGNKIEHHYDGCSGHEIPEKKENEWINNPSQKDSNGNDIPDGERWNTFMIYVPYIIMEPVGDEEDAQEFLVTQDIETIQVEGEEIIAGGSSNGNAQRTYQRVSKEVDIDLTMELGGYVWVDANGGKEDISNGVEDENEVRVPNVIVTLSDGRDPVKTNSNGEYKFTGLNAMYQYSVTFTYNGQYYQPTTFNDSSTWGKVSTVDSTNWKTNSNAKDVRNERLSYNLKFESIGSSPENYEGSAGYNETFTKQELLGYTLQSDGSYEKTRKPVIDDYGNLILESSSDRTTQKMIQYVKDCMMNAYTIADGAAGLYPVPSIFLIADSYKWGQTPKLLMNGDDTNGNKVGISGISMLYPNAYYINLGLDERQEFDLAIKKDVDHVTLEINGQTHNYTYDEQETLYHCSKCNKSVNYDELVNENGILKCPTCKTNIEELWDIGVKISDGYYNTNYSRELYKSDYIYKVSMYGSQAADLGKTKADELEIFITYKILIRNQSLSIRGRIDEVVDYYDTDLEYVDERSYIEIKQSRKDAAQKGIYSVKASNTSRYSGNTVTKIDGYDNLYITGLGSMVNNENNNYLAAGQTAYVYLTFKVKKDKDNIDKEDWVKLDEEVVSGNAIGVGKENIVEINGYSTQYAEGTEVPNIGYVSFKPAGIVDRDSNPGNLDPADVPKDGAIKYENFEDDTDKAPNMRIILYRDDETNRVIAGNVWEDARTESIEVTTTGDGIRSNNETLINGVTVQLVEIMENGKEYIWREFGAPATALGEEIGGPNTIDKGTGTGTTASETPIINYKNLVSNYEFASSHDGSYAFKSFMPGKYVVRFIYGDTERTVTPKSLNAGGLNEKSYNGQDYKSTTYQEGVVQNRSYTWREASTWNLGQETKGRPLTEITGLKADASNNETVTLPQKDANGNFTYLPVENQKGYLYNITESEKYNGSDRNYPLVSDAKDIESRRNEVTDYSDNNVTNYIAEVLASHKSDYNTMNDRTQLLNDLKTNTKMTAETGLMVIELEYDREGTEDQTVGNTSSYKILNVDLGLEERAKSALVLDKEITNVKLTLADGSILFDAKSTASNVLWRDHKAYSVGYKGNFLDESKFGSIQNIRNKNSNKFGLIQLTMDEELMHGATIEITYKVTVSNVGEVDYKDNLFYYTGNKSSNAQVVTTRADQVIDYVANNLQFNASQNSNWRVIEKEDIRNQGLVNEKLKEQVDKYNTVIITDNLSKDLVPNLYKEKVDASRDDSVSVPLILTQLITSENDSDDLTYRNMVELVKTSNTAGRRMEYSVVGNQDPTEKPQELDSDISEIVRILPPFGNAGRPIIILLTTLAALVILTTGVILIKKKVLKK